MKKKYLFVISLTLFTCILGLQKTLAQTLGTSFFNIAKDDASNYSSWSNGDNQGNGFGTWTFTKTGIGGHYLGSTSEGNPSFGIYAGGNSGNSATAERSFNSDLKMGDRFSVNIGHSTGIATGGEVFLQLLDDGTPVITLKFVGGTSDWQLNDGGTDFGIAQPYSANTSLEFTFTYNEDGTYSYTFGAASGNNFTASNTISGINGFKFESNAQGSGENFGLDDMNIDSKYTITDNSSVSVNTTITAPYLTVESGSSLTVNTGVGLTISGNLSNNGTVTSNSGSSIIVNGSSSGNITYNRSFSSTNWHFIGSPVIGETIEDFITNNSLASGINSRVGLIAYDNSKLTINERWLFQTTTSTGSLLSGTGYAAKLASTGTVTFIGTIPTNNIGISITNETGNGGDAYNLVGNPYPSFIAANTNANGTNNILSNNSAILTEETLWFWNQATNSYDAINQVSSAFQIAPTQGFFVKSSGNNTFNFTEVMQSHQSTDSFQKLTNTRPEIKLIITDGTSTSDAKIFYLNDATLGFDNGYDSSIFEGAEDIFALYSIMLESDANKKLGIQSLPNSNLENMIITIGLSATTNKEITFTVETKNLPEGINVYLEDSTLNKFIRLDEVNSNYKITLNNATDGINRFYIHTTSKALSTTPEILNNLTIYKTNDNRLKVDGLQNEAVLVTVYTIFGKQLFQKSVSNFNNNEILLPNLASGIYIVQLQNEANKVSKKIILE